MRHWSTPLIAALLVLAAAPSAPADSAVAPPLPASSIAPAAGENATDAYADLYHSLIEGMDDEATMDTMLVTMTDQLQKQQPLLAVIEQGKPGLMVKLRQAIRPVLTEYSARARQLYRPQVIATMREELTADDARQLAAIYRSPAGKKLLKAGSAAYTGEAVIGGALKDPSAPVPEDAVKSDLHQAAQSGFDSLTAEEQHQFVTMALATPAIFKMPRVNERIMQIRVEMEEVPLTADEEQRLTDAVKSTIERHMSPDEPAAGKAD